jgi:hypothetical protein
MPCSNDDCPGLDVIEEDTSLQQVLAVYERRRVRITIELHEVTKAALASHFEHCSYLCTTNHIKCLIGRRLVTIEETAWFAARIEISGTNGSTVTDPQPVPHEPCCTNARAPVPLVADGDGER